MISYIGREEMPHGEIFPKMNKLLTLFIEEVKNKLDEKI
jgi:ribonuclease P protein component